MSSAIVISSPDENEGNEEVDQESKDLVRGFWSKMMARYKTEDEYNRQIIDAFKGSGDPEILIVVSKLLTGFDARGGVPAAGARRASDPPKVGVDVASRAPVAEPSPDPGARRRDRLRHHARDLHLEQPHHGTAFFDLLRRVMPDWEKGKEHLERILA